MSVDKSLQKLPLLFLLFTLSDSEVHISFPENNGVHFCAPTSSTFAAAMRRRMVTVERNFSDMIVTNPILTHLSNKVKENVRVTLFGDAVESSVNCEPTPVSIYTPIDLRPPSNRPLNGN